MKKLLLPLLLIYCFSVPAQPLNHAMSAAEKLQMGDYLRKHQQDQLFSGITIPPVSPVRASAEWEEIDALIIAWTNPYYAIQRDIIRFSQTETQVYIVCNDSNVVISNLNSFSVPLTNVHFLIVPYNSI